MEKVITDFKCNLCNKYYSSYQSLWIHNKKYHNPNVTHSVPNVILKKSNVIQKESNIASLTINTNILECKYCHKTYANRHSKSKHLKNCKEKKIKDDDILKKNNDLDIIKNSLTQLLLKQTKIHQKPMQKINNNKLYDYHINNKLINSDYYNKIIKSDDNKFQFDLNKNFLTFYDKPIKYFFYNDQVYFKGKDIATILEYEDTKQAIRYNVNIDDRIKINQLLGDGVKNTPSPKTSLLESEHPNTVFINESGFYSLILASKKPEAIEFKKWVTSVVLPSIRKTGSYNLIDNYIEEDLEKYQNKDCVYIIHIKDNIYKYGNTSHIFKRLQAHKTNLNYNKIIKIYDMNNMNEAIKLENKIKTLVKTLNINTVYNTHIEIFEVDNNNLQNLIKKIDELSLKINKNQNNKYIDLINENIKQLEEKTKQDQEKTKQMEINNENIKLHMEFFKLTGKMFV
jgi:prophage antirepressor-like protein